jgi:hypothetical protein
MRKTLVPIALAFALIAVAPAAFAGSNNSTLTVNSSVAANCTITSASLDFPAYDVLGVNAASPLNASTTMDVACTRGLNPQVGFAAAGGTITGGGGSLNYTLWQDNGHSIAFGPSGAGLKSLGAAPTKAPRSFTIFGEIPAGQDVPAAALYTGTIQAIVNF